MSELLISRAPTGVSLQDAGRTGYLRYGVSRAGAMDWARHAMANCMLGKSFLSTVIEVGPAGLGLSLTQGDLQISFAGPRFSLVIEDVPITSPCRTMLRQGQSLEIIPKAGAMWGYLGIQGTIDAPKILGAQSENSVSGICPFKIEPGCTLSIAQSAPRTPLFQTYVDPYIAHEKQAIRIIPSSQFEDFSDEMKTSLISWGLMIDPRFDRMAYRLQGVNIVCDKGHDILSDGVTMGAIQVPGDGKPFILMADHQSTGGYPKIGCVCKADLPRLAQMAPGRNFKMAWQTVDQALQEWFVIHQQISAMTALSSH